jgi:hypothetical protein
LATSSIHFLVSSHSSWRKPKLLSKQLQKE